MSQSDYFHCKTDYQNLSSNVYDDVKLLLHEFENLPVDRYNNERQTRSRALSTGHILLDQQPQVIFNEPVIHEDRNVYPIDQKQYNIDVNSTRYVDAISPSLRNTKLLQNLIIADFKKTNLIVNCPKNKAFFMLNFIKYRVNIDNPIAVTSLPNLFHQDGATFIVVHLINRDNISVESGFNAFATMKAKHLEYDKVNPSDILYKFIMYNFLESYGCLDRKYTHYSSSIKLEGKRDHGSRGIAIMLFFDSYNAYKNLGGI